MYLCNTEEENLSSTSVSLFDQVLVTSQFTYFRVIPHKLWRWEKSLTNLDLRGHVILPESFWTSETADG